jgi:hypothetical protein
MSEYTIYQNEIDDAVKLFEKMPSSPLVVLKKPMQSGGTNTALVAANLYAKHCAEFGKKLKVIYLLHCDYTATQEDIISKCGAAFSFMKNRGMLHLDIKGNAFLMVRRGELKNYTKSDSRDQHGNLHSFIFPSVKKSVYERLAYNPDADRLLIICDEAQLAQGLDRSVDKFLKHLGVEMGKDPSVWKNQNARILFVSATPFGADLKNKACGYRYFDFFQPTPGPGYFGEKELLESGRLKPAFETIVNGQVSDDAKRVIEEDIVPCIQSFAMSGKVPEVLWRVRKGTDQQILKGYLESRFTNTAAVHVYHSNEAESGGLRLGPNIGDLTNKNVQFHILVDAMSIGVSISKERLSSFICAIEHPVNDVYLNSIEKAIQNYGRHFGYGKGELTYNIYASRLAIEHVHDWRNGDGPVMKGPGNDHELVAERKLERKAKKNVLDRWEVIGECDDFSGRTVSGNSEQDLAGDIIKGNIRFGVRSVSNNNARDMAKEIVDGKLGRGGSGAAEGVILVDGENKNFPDSWLRLKELRSDLVGKAIIPVIKDKEAVKRESVAATALNKTTTLAQNVR